MNVPSIAEYIHLRRICLQSSFAMPEHSEGWADVGAAVLLQGSSAATKRLNASPPESVQLQRNLSPRHVPISIYNEIRHLLTPLKLEMKRKLATPAGAVTEQRDGATWAEDPGLSAAREAAEAMPAESVQLQRNLSSLYFSISN